MRRIYNNNKLNSAKCNQPNCMFNNTIQSLNEVECFLSNWKKIIKGIKIYNILK